jgi:hypothetical protein
VVVAAVVGVFASLGAGEAELLAAALSGVAVAALAAGLWRERPIVVPWALLFLGGAAALAFAEEGDPGRSPLYAGALIAVGELSYWSLETRLSRPASPGIAARRVALLSGLVAGSIAVGAILVSVARIDPGGGLLLEAVGVAAVVAAAAFVFALSRRAA